MGALGPGIERTGMWKRPVAPQQAPAARAPRGDLAAFGRAALTGGSGAGDAEPAARTGTPFVTAAFDALRSAQTVLMGGGDAGGTGDADPASAALVADEEKRRRMAMGRSSTIATSARGVSGDTNIGRRVLLGGA